MTTTLNDSYQSSPLTVGQGGRGTSSVTAYGLIAAGTVSTGNMQNLGAGTSNQILVSGGASALATQTNNNTVGTWQLVSSQVASTSASIVFTGLTNSYQAYKLLISNFVPVNASAHILMRISTDNGATYKSGSTDYNYAIRRLTQAGTGTNTNLTGGGSQILIDFQGFSTSTLGSQFELTFVDITTSRAGNGVYWIGNYFDNTSSNINMVIGEGYYTTSAAINALQFKASSGNISSGTFKLYGILT